MWNDTFFLRLTRADDLMEQQKNETEVPWSDKGYVLTRANVDMESCEVQYLDVVNGSMRM